MTVFGALLRGLRKGKELTQPELARRTGIQAPVLSNMEKGKRLPNLEHIGLLALALDVQPRELIPDALIELVRPLLGEPRHYKANSGTEVQPEGKS
jgi:transcriptional regulator with XRE-family HTH domain